MPILLDGKALAHTLRQELAQEVQARASQGSKAPHLAIILIGHDLASHTYVNNKLKACREVGFQTTLIQQSTIEASLLLRLIEEINATEDIDGLIVQLPLPQSISAHKVIQAIKPEKDVDGLHTFNYGRMACNLPSHIPATPLGILMLLRHYRLHTKGSHCVIIGRGPTVGAPLSILMSSNSYPGNATVTLCHSHTQDLASLTRQADIVIIAVGQPNLLTASMVKERAIVIDVGITRVPDITKKNGYRLQGDVAFSEVSAKCSYITPVPGGVGPMTIVALLSNTLRAAKKEVYS